MTDSGAAAAFQHLFTELMRYHEAQRAELASKILLALLSRVLHEDGEVAADVFAGRLNAELRAMARLNGDARTFQLMSFPSAELPPLQ